VILIIKKQKEDHSSSNLKEKLLVLISKQRENFLIKYQTETSINEQHNTTILQIKLQSGNFPIQYSTP
jgi:hypothetical protein